MTSCGWLWLYFGVLLMFAELAAPGFVIFFFGLAAASVAVLRFVFGDAFTISWQVGMFSILSVIYLVGLRRFFKGVFGGTVTGVNANVDDEYVGRVGKVTEAINPPLNGRVLIGDAEWSAIADNAIDVNSNVKVISRNNLTLKVEVCK